MANMKVILATKIEGLGCEADLVTVKAGYGRNYLIPQGLAFEATPANQRFINMLQKKRAEREAAELANFQEIAAKIAAVTVNLTLEAGENGKVFGTITNQQITEGLAALGIEIDRHSIELEKPLKKSGTYEVAAKLHAQVTATVKVVLVVKGEKVEEAPAADEEA
ncbi:MAG: 50S ribosomal protein L9 [Akkermansia sp.]|nr:50S ribosomal protein L9 [Akkermansia sp.]